MAKFDYLIVGAGLYGATFAHLAHKQGKKCLVIDKRPHLGGNLYCENVEGINVHKYGAHIFHTSNKQVWDFVNSIVEFNHYVNSPVANYQGKLYNLPFNMNTFYQMWGVTTPIEAIAKIEEQKMEAMAKMKADGVFEPRNLEEQAQILIGNTLYSVSKSAVDGFMKNAAKELAEKGIRVNSVNPGMVDTPINDYTSVSEEQKLADLTNYPLKRHGKPEEIAYAIIYLLSDAAAWVTGTALKIDGGYSL